MVHPNGRINGSMSVARAFGDFNFKAKYRTKPEDQAITACPEITVRDRSDADDFIVLACDGIWDSLSSE